MAVVWATLLLNSCANRGPENIDGGDCHYTTHHYAAKVVAIQEIDSLLSEMVFVMHRSSIPETLYYSMVFGSFAHDSITSRPNAAVGSEWDYQHRQLISGACTPDIFVLTNGDTAE